MPISMQKIVDIIGSIVQKFKTSQEESEET